MKFRKKAIIIALSLVVALCISGSGSVTFAEGNSEAENQEITNENLMPDGSSEANTIDEGGLDSEIAQDAEENEVNESASEEVPFLAKRGPGVASMDGIVYENLQDAIDAASGEATITILDDIALTATVKVPAGKKITLKDDGKQHTIAAEEGTKLAPLFTILAGGELTLDATSDDKLVLQGSEISGNKVTLISSKGTFNLKSAKLEGGSVSGYQTSAILIDSGSTFNMSGGIVENLTGSISYGAAVVVNSGGKFNMSGGQIRNNKNSNTGTFAAGGVMLNNWSGSKIEFTMTGGTISGNTGNNGGGVMLVGATDFHLLGGEISGNNARQQGGGVCVSGANMDSSCYDTCSFIMDGGTVADNSARNGGGIYVNSDAVYLNAGNIENNTARATSYNQWSGHGGGVYVSQVPRVLHVNDAVITDNTASALLGIGGTSGMGGGLWACPTGSIELHVTNGVAVYNNHAVGRDSAGDDVVNVHNSSGVHGTITLSDRMLGGGSVDWYEDGGILDSVVGYVDNSVPRYDPDNPGEKVHLEDSPERVALKAVTSDAAIQRANEEAKLFITGNKANHGGGLGTNGKLTLTNHDVVEWTLNVTKEWDGISQSDQKPVQVYLKISGTILDSVTLEESNNWTASFTELPDPASLKTNDISVVEGSFVTNASGDAVFEETNSYKVDYEKVIQEETQTIFVKVINSAKPEEPGVTESNEPGNPDNPAQPSKAEAESAVETNDTFNPWLTLAIMLVSLLAMIAGFTFRRRTWR